MMKIKKKTISETVIVLVVMSLCILTSSLILVDTHRPNYYDMLWILPFIYMMLFLLVWHQFPAFKYTVSSSIILAIYGARMVIVPMIMYLGNYSTYGESTIYGRYMGLAIMLMCWEFMVVTTFIITTFWKKNKYNNDFLVGEYEELNMYSAGLPRKMRISIMLVALYVVLILIGTPGLLEESFFFTTGRTEGSYDLYFSGSVSHRTFGLSIGPQLVTIAFTFFWVLQALLPPYLLARICTIVKSTQIRKALFALVLLATLLISTEGRAHSIESALTLMITATYALKDNFKVNPRILIILIVGVMIYGLMDKSGVSTSGEAAMNEFSIMISAYFSGPQNVATAIAATKQSNSLGMLNIFSDFLQRIPYLTKYFTPLFGGTSNVIFNQYFGSEYLGQIIPSIGLGYSYFGFVFAPTIPIIAVWCSLHFEKKAQASPDIISKNLYYLGVIMMARATAMSNMLSGVTYLGNFFFAWLIIYIGLSKRFQSNVR